ncbi:hypothetical protein FEM48_Zijuj10G0093100 [Ziziphus jujuba var. spinosa]|uniref:Uncharacterized protein n=1 Tax=Ziziphus jujuba var. spinosa TaxID=714518 RepID=A0A978UMJ5_ZIZJJ|nr:hypothetical protein FEM48_Zijuj10G0093100 [Ziziphus jujuba var. spinosa]
MAFSGDKVPVGKETHIALFPSSGMGHLTPFLRLASLLLHHHCRVTLITTNPTVSHAESRLVSRFLSSYPQVTQIHFNLLPLDLSTVNSTDPFWIQSETIRRSAHLLSPLLSSVSSPPLSGLISDVMLVSYVLPVAQTLRLPNYILFTSSARMFSFFAYLPTITSICNVGSVFDGEDLHIPGINSPLPRSSIPPLLLIQNSLFADMFFSDSLKLTKLDGVLINSFKGLETESLETLRSRKLMEDLPPVFAVGPFEPCDGLGMWVRNWGWGGEKVVKGDEIGEKVREMMESQSLKLKARDVGEEAMKVAEAGGNREEMFKELIGDLKRKL